MTLKSQVKDVKKTGERCLLVSFAQRKMEKKSDKPVKDKKSQMKHSSDITALKFEHFAVAGA